MVSPARVTRQLIGVPNITIAKKLAKVATHFNYENLAIVTSEDGLDEVSIYKKTAVFEVKGKSLRKYTIDPKDYGMSSVKGKPSTVKKNTLNPLRFTVNAIR